jgi:hypothetical protein
MRKIRFLVEERGITFLVTNYRYINGSIEFKEHGCWKYPYKEKELVH